MNIPIYFFVLLIGISCFLTGCLPVPSSPISIPTDTLSPATNTPTLTPIWFPPTPTNTPFPTPTIIITPTVSVLPSYGELIFSDNFDQPELWELNRSSKTNSAIANNELTLALSKGGEYVYSLRQEPELDDFYLEVTANPSICKGSDEYGLLVRFVDSGNFFRFALTCDGQARADRLLKNTPSSPQPLSFSGAIPPGAPSVSRLSLWAEGRELRFYANGEYLFSISDPSLPKGKIGFFVRSKEGNAVTVNFSKLDVYEPNP
jgi:hypothetical protein